MAPKSQPHTEPEPVRSLKDILPEQPNPVAFRSPLSHREVSELTYRSNTQGLLQTLFHASCIIGPGVSLWLSRGHFVPATLSTLVLSFTMSFLFCALHESVHETVFKSKVLNWMLANVTGFLTFRPPRHYWFYHWAHHRHTGDLLKDPELQNTLLDMDISTLSGYIMYLSGVPFWMDRLHTLQRHCRGKFTEDEYYLKTPQTASSRVRREAQEFVLLYFILFALGIWWRDTFGPFLVTYWIMPSIIGQIHLRFYLFAEHKGCDFGGDIFGNTRTTITSWFYRRLAWNMPFHAEHHAWPSVAFHCLPRVHDTVNSKLGPEKRTELNCRPSGENGYAHVSWSFFRKAKAL